MRVKMQCLSEEPGGYNGANGPVKYQQLALLDISDPKESRMVNSIDFRILDEADKEKYAGKVMDKTMIIDIKDIEIFNGRLKVKTGKIVEVIGLNGEVKPAK